MTKHSDEDDNEEDKKMEAFVNELSPLLLEAQDSTASSTQHSLNPYQTDSIKVVNYGTDDNDHYQNHRGIAFQHELERRQRNVWMAAMVVFFMIVGSKYYFQKAPATSLSATSAALLPSDLPVESGHHRRLLRTSPRQLTTDPESGRLDKASNLEYIDIFEFP